MIAFTTCPICGNHYTTQDTCPVCRESRQKAQISAVNTPLLMDTPQKVKVKKKWKYKVDESIFDSKTEAWRYIVLRDLQSRGVIRDLELQPEYIIRPAYQLSGQWYKRTKADKPRTIAAEKYHPDFRYTITALNLTVIEEVKGLNGNRPYSKQASNYKQYSLQATIAHCDNIVFWICAGKSNGSVWRYFQQSRGYPELTDPFTLKSRKSA